MLGFVHNVEIVMHIASTPVTLKELIQSYREVIQAEEVVFDVVARGSWRFAEEAKEFWILQKVGSDCQQIVFTPIELAEEDWGTVTFSAQCGPVSSGEKIMTAHIDEEGKMKISPVGVEYASEAAR
jgi:hypothetical protein